MPLQVRFIKNVLTLATGTGLSQLIPIVVSPILTRLYSPDQFGIFALYLSLSTTLAIIATGRYELAIVLPKLNANSIHLSILAVFLASIFCLTLIFAYMVMKSIVSNENNEWISWFLYVPFGVFLLSLVQVLSYLLNRLERYQVMAKVKVVQSITAALVSIIFAVFFPWDYGLIIGSILGMLASVILSGFFILKEVEVSRFNVNRVYYLSRVYKQFPKFGIVSGVSNTLSSNSPIFILSHLSLSAASGCFSLANRMLMIPLGVIGGAVSQVFLKEASTNKDNKENIACLAKKTVRQLFYIGVIPSAIIVSFGDVIFSFVFGSEWKEAGVYASILSPLLFFIFIASPTNSIFIAYEKQKEALNFNILLLLVRVLSLVTVFYFGGGAIELVLWYVVVSLFIWASQVQYVFKVMNSSAIFLIRETCFYIALSCVLLLLRGLILNGFTI